MSYKKTTFLNWIIVLAVAFLTVNASAANLQLPDLGDAGSSLLSPEQEYQLGQKLLRIYRSQVPITRDPFLQDYVEKLVRRLATHSELKDKRLEIMVIENPNLNAFAIPGGVVGIHTGLFSYSDNEQQLASVVAHELAHLSQRHHARGREQAKKNAIPTMAATIASILIAATAGSEAGVAALSVTQATAIDSQLRFSRQMEQEADRLAMETLVRADMDPYAMPQMFGHILKSTRYYQRPPEFLLTHPLPESRVSDSMLRAQQYSKKHYLLDPEYMFIKTRIVVLHEGNSQALIKRFKNNVNSERTKLFSDYGLALTYMRSELFDEAHATITPLLQKHPNDKYLNIAMGEILAGQNKHKEAVELFESLYKKYPSYHPLNIRYAEVLMELGEYKTCQRILERHAVRRPKDDYVWYLLAEVHGLAGDIFKVHTARAEYFMLNGLFEKAEIQLKNASKLVEENIQLKAQLEEKLKLARKLRLEMAENKI